MKRRSRTGRRVAPEREHYRLRLYVTGMTQHSQQALANIRRLCERHLAQRHELEVIDIYESASRALADDIIAAPTLVKLEPLPVRRFVGNLADTARVLSGLGLDPLAAGEPPAP